MKLSALAGAVSAAALLAAAPAALADHQPGMTSPVTAVAVDPSMTIVETAIASPDHTTLVAAVTAAGLVGTLSGEGPFTVFAPTDAAFAALPEGVIDALVQPENKAVLTRVLTYHVVAGRVTAADVIGLIEAGGGSAAIETLSGDTLTASLRDGSVILTDENGGVATVTQADIIQSNGVIHVTDAVSVPQ